MAKISVTLTIKVRNYCDENQARDGKSSIHSTVGNTPSHYNSDTILLYLFPFYVFHSGSSNLRDYIIISKGVGMSSKGGIMPP